ncbi:MAG: ATP-dependent sacrificial sulfur transferase LarE [Eubacterium sp.]|nr:ATP-dependent sacrificial sulfur transferase LarE [Eubacterium sp.]
MELQQFFEQHPSVAVAFSGGVDSAVLLCLAKQYAADVKAYYVQSAFQPQFELADARALAAQLDVPLTVLPLDVLSDERIAANPPNRCYYCKQKIFAAILRQAKADGLAAVLDGTNATDRADDRPGMRALQELGVFSPLRLCGYTKAMIRQIARDRQLPVSDKPSYACLATRIPAGTAITDELLQKTERAEEQLRAMGLVNFRVRYRRGAALLQLGKDDFPRLLAQKNAVLQTLSADYEAVYLDLKERPDDD